MQLLGSKRLKDGRTVLPAGQYTKPTENQAIMNMETGEIITPSLKDQRIAKMIEDNKKRKKEMQDDARESKGESSRFKTNSKAQQFYSRHVKGTWKEKNKGVMDLLDAMENKSEIDTKSYLGKGFIVKMNPPSKQYVHGNVVVRNDRGKTDKFDLIQLADKTQGKGTLVPRT